MPNAYHPLSVAIQEEEAKSNVAMLNVNLVSLEDFEVFLHESLNQLFYCCNVELCPIAQYLKDRFDDPDIHVGLYRAYKTVCGVEETLLRFESTTNTLWMFQFIERFDAQHQSHKPVRGKDILEFLETWKQRFGYDSNSLKGKNEKQEATGEDSTQNLQG